jgi:hypothetical protein
MASLGRFLSLAAFHWPEGTSTFTVKGPLAAKAAAQRKRLKKLKRPVLKRHFIEILYHPLSSGSRSSKPFSHLKFIVEILTDMVYVIQHRLACRTRSGTP